MNFSWRCSETRPSRVGVGEAHRGFLHQADGVLELSLVLAAATRVPTLVPHQIQAAGLHVLVRGQ